MVVRGSESNQKGKQIVLGMQTRTLETRKKKKRRKRRAALVAGGGVVLMQRE